MGQVQVSLFQDQEEIESLKQQIDEKTEVWASEKRHALVPLKVRRRAAIRRLRAVGVLLEGETVSIGWCGGSGSHFWAESLTLRDLHLDGSRCWGEVLPFTMTIWGKGNQYVKVFTDQLYDVRQQDYGTYYHWLVDFYNGYPTHPIDQFRPRGFSSFTITITKKRMQRLGATVSSCSCGWVGIGDSCPRCQKPTEVVVLDDRGPACFYDEGLGRNEKRGTYRELPKRKYRSWGQPAE